VTCCATHPLFLFLAVWSVALALYGAGVAAGTFPFPHALTIVALWLNIATFSLGYLTWALLRRPVAPCVGLLPHPRAPAPPRQIERALVFTLVMGMTALGLMLYRAAQMAVRSHTGLLQLLTSPYLLRSQLVEFIEASAWQTSPMVMLLSVSTGLFTIGFILLGVFLRLDGTFRRYVYLFGFLLVAFATCMVNLSRYDMTMDIMYLVLAYGVADAFAPDRTRRRLARDLLAPAVGLVIIFVAVEILLRKSATYGESGTWRSILFSLYWYVASPIAALNDFLVHFPGDYTLGERTFAPFFKWLSRFHLIPEHSFSVFGEFVLIPYPANAYTYLRNFYEDFGLLGVAVVPYGFGCLLAATKELARRHFQFLNLHVLVLVPILFSFFSYPLLSSQFYLQILFGFIFFRYELDRGGKQWNDGMWE
jgi:oligosaccharide repeat unit polymerase